MKQGVQETNDNYLSRFKSNIAAVKLTDGEHIFLSQILSAEGDITTLTDKEILDEQECSKAIILLKCSEAASYSKLIQNLKEATYVDRDKYPTSIASMYELDVHFNPFSIANVRSLKHIDNMPG